MDIVAQRYSFSIQKIDRKFHSSRIAEPHKKIFVIDFYTALKLFSLRANYLRKK